MTGPVTVVCIACKRDDCAHCIDTFRLIQRRDAVPLCGCLLPHDGDPSVVLAMKAIRRDKAVRYARPTVWQAHVCRQPCGVCGR